MDFGSSLDERNVQGLGARGQCSCAFNTRQLTQRLVSSSFSRYLRSQKLPNQIGYASCATQLSEGDTSYIVYKYDVFRDRSSERTLIAHQTMYVDPVTRLPLKFETPFDDGKEDFVSVETRQYDANLKVEAPIKEE